MEVIPVIRPSGEVATASQGFPLVRAAPVVCIVRQAQSKTVFLDTARLCARPEEVREQTMSSPEGPHCLLLLLIFGYQEFGGLKVLVI